jgi:hypothetical protein
MRMIGKSALAAGALTLALTSGVFIGQAIADQPHMQAALDALRTAKGELEMATHNKGGHRVEALRLTEDAIRETKAGIDAGEW